MGNKIKQNIKIEDLLPLREQEMNLLYILRNKYQQGSVEIIVRDGIPYDILRTVERVRLTGLSPERLDQM